MIVLMAEGGLGNQLFDFVLYKTLMGLGKDVYIDKRMLSPNFYHGEFIPEHIFKLNIQYIDSQAILLHSVPAANLRILKKGLRIVHKIIAGQRYVYQSDMLFHPFSRKSIKDLDDVVITNPLFISEKYFKPIEDVIRSQLIFRVGTDEINLRWIDKINQSNSASIHVRRGDYVGFKPCEGVCDIEYYTKAIEYIENKEKNIKFFVFSNDIEWCQSELKLPNNTEFVNNNYGDNDYKDMMLMSLCKHNIIANSTFSWWGAWLNNNPNKIVIAPKHFYKRALIRYYDIDGDVFPSEWKKI